MYKEILHEDFKQKEFPNVLNIKGHESNLTESIERLKIGKNILESQKYEILEVYDPNESHIIVEAKWSGIIKNEIGSFQAGQLIKANFCIICEFVNGKIISQKNYDSFEPF